MRVRRRGGDAVGRLRRDLILLAALTLVSCRPSPAVFGQSDFEGLMHRLAESWSTQDTERALSCFTQDAVYMEPPDVQYYRGHKQLEPYFAALKPGTFMRFHHLWFDDRTGQGAGEFTFGRTGHDRATVGMVMVEIRDGRIARWREYPRKGPANFDQFISTEGKKWQWHIGNYP